MPETVLEQVLVELKTSAAEHYPEAGELAGLRVVGHLPRHDHFIYDLCADFARGVERLAVKVYRPAKNGTQANALAARENENLQFVQRALGKRKLEGVPRPLGDFTRLGAVVTAKISGLPLQSMIMKAALLPGNAAGNVASAARQAGEWLRRFHKATALVPPAFDGDALVARLEELCVKCRQHGLDENSVHLVLNAARKTLVNVKKNLPSSAVLGEFSPLNVIVTDDGVGYSDFSRLQQQSASLEDVAQFLAAVEALEKYPFCDREITRNVQETFLEAYGANPAEAALLPLLKIKALLGIFAHAGDTKAGGARKTIMWANIMRRFIRQAAQRTLEPMAA